MSRRKKFQRIGVVAKVASRDAVYTAHELAEWLRRRGLVAALDEATLRARGVGVGNGGVGGDAVPFRPEDPYDLVVVRLAVKACKMATRIQAPIKATRKLPQKPNV